jgi:ADP-ribosylglycohydrolase
MNQGTIDIRERILAGLWGVLVGDAVGVPVEFRKRPELRLDPVTDMREYGTHRQPKGTWSDDGALTLCTVESLSNTEFDPADMGERFVRWYQDGLWTATGEVFDVGVTTSEGLGRILNGVRAEVAGSDAQNSNGNGSLMRILPVAIRFSGLETAELLRRVHTASAITHRHFRSQMACGLYALVVQGLLKNQAPQEALTNGLAAFRDFYSRDTSWAVELYSFQLLLAGDLARREERDIDSSGYVVHTLNASLWCLLTTGTFEQCILKAVNLGDDTDTTGCVAGGLAGIHYGLEAIPLRWREAMARKQEVSDLFVRFVTIVTTTEAISE